MTALLSWRVWAAVSLVVLLAATYWKAYKMGELSNQARSDAEKVFILKSQAEAAAKQYQVSDKAASLQAAKLVSINKQLGAAREKIALLSGRECFSADTVGVLNTIGAGGEPVPAASGNLEGAPAAPASGGGVRFATERDAASAIATCRGRYAEVASQINQILDIEDARQAPGKGQ